MSISTQTFCEFLELILDDDYGITSNVLDLLAKIGNELQSPKLQSILDQIEISEGRAYIDDMETK